MIFVFKLVFVVYLFSVIALMIKMANKKFAPSFVPASVYERAVVWYQEIDEMPESHRMIEMSRWVRFINNIPRRKERLRILGKR